MSQNRLRILTQDEIDALYARPKFTLDERHEYFLLTPAEHDVLKRLRTDKSRLYFILQLGYFKAKHRFFIFDLADVPDDVSYVTHRYFDHKPEGPSVADLVNKQTRRRQQRLILQLCRYRLCNDQHRHQLRIKAQQAARVSGKPIYVFRFLWKYLAEHRIVVPGYSFMQDLVTQALQDEQGRLRHLLQEYLDDQARKALDVLLEDSQGLYQITQLKREPKDFSLSQIKLELQRGQHLLPLYGVAQRMLPILGISNESVTYYASLVHYYSVYRLKRLDRWVSYGYLLCFVYHRHQRLHDHLIESLRYKVRRYQQEAKEVAKEKVYQLRIQTNTYIQKAGLVLKLFTDESISTEAPFSRVQAQAFSILEPEHLDYIADHMRTQTRFDPRAFEWSHIDTLARQFKGQLRPVLRALALTANSAGHPLLDAAQWFKSAFEKGRPLRPPLPDQFIPDTMRRYLFAATTTSNTEVASAKRPLVDRHEFLLYRQLRQGIEAGDIFCRDSVRFRSFEDDLIDDQSWQHKKHLIAQTGLTMLEQPIEAHLESLKGELEYRLAEVNARIASGQNEYIQIKPGPSRRVRSENRSAAGTGPKRWSLKYPAGREPINHSFFNALDQVQIADVLHFVDQHCAFLQSFEHVLGRYVKTDVDARVLVAALLAWGTNMGLGQMAQNSDISYTALAQTSDNFIRLETLATANDRIANATAALPLFRHYDMVAQGQTVLHSSSDGQRFETRLHTFKARHSPKYFGLKKGVVSYTLVANHVPVNAELIGAHDHESHYVFDLLFNNTTEIDPEIHSTDTDGSNHVNFALLHLFGYQFAPRYKDLYDKVRTSLYGFSHPKHYDDSMLLKPIRKINTRLIIEEWPNIERILVSLALKTTRQSIIISKLSAHARKNKTKRALWEYDHIIQSLYLLDYIDSPPLRRNVQRALNRGENYHQLRRAVSFANFGKLRFKTEYEQKLWNESSRLITNTIIYYNMALLSALWTQKKQSSPADAPSAEDDAAVLAQISPVAWQHINLSGRYEFGSTPVPIDLMAIIDRLARLPLVDQGNGRA